MFGENLPIDSFSRRDRNVGAGLSKAENLLERRLFCLLPGQENDLLLQTWTLTINLWRLMDIPDEMKKVLDDLGLATFCRGFTSELKTAVAQLWRWAVIRQ